MLNNFRYAIRWLYRSPGFALVAIISLGLGIGVNAAMFALVDAVLLRPIPVHDAGSLVDVFTNSSDGDQYATTSYPDFLDLKQQNAVFSEMTAYTPMFAPLNLGGDRSRLVMGHLVTSNHFQMLGITPFLGRVLQPSDDNSGVDRVAVISHQMWLREFGGDPDAIGRPLRLRGLDYTIVGVAPPVFTGVIPLLVPELWLPVTHCEEVEPAGINDNVPSPIGKTRLERRGSRWLFVKGRLKPGLTAKDANANVALIARQLESAYPATNKDRQMSAFATSEVRLLVPQASGPIAIGSAAVMAVVGLVLLIACANVAGMLLARASARRREISVRLAIGASRKHLVQQMLSEGVVLGICGCVVAIGLAYAIVQTLGAIQLPIPGSLGLDLHVDHRVIGFALVVAVGAGLLASLTPALKASSPQLTNDLRGEAPVGALGRRWSVRELLVVGQLALTAVLLVVAGLLLRTLSSARSTDVGFRMDGLAMVAVDTDMVRYSPDRARQFWSDALERIQGLPGVEAAALVSPRLPFDINFSQTTVRIDGTSYKTETAGEVVSNVAVSPDYFETLGIPVLEGRGIRASDREGSPPVAVINETMARRFWPDGSAVGKTFTFAHGNKRFEVVGVVGNHKVHTVNEQPRPYLHFAAAQQPASYNHLVARTRGDATQLLASIRREVLSMEPGAVFIRSTTMEASMATALLPERISAALAGAFGGLGMLLAAIGLYGVVAYSVARRTREIGIRMAVGANPGGVLGMVMRQGLGVAVIGAAIGALLAAGAAQLLRGVLYGVSPADPIAWSAAFGALFVAAALANFIPARRAMRVDPVTALRVE